MGTDPIVMQLIGVNLKGGVVVADVYNATKMPAKMPVKIILFFWCVWKTKNLTWKNL